jgi:hypothetical protein
VNGLHHEVPVLPFGFFGGREGLVNKIELTYPVEKARSDYGVVINSSTMTIDMEATVRLRGGEK